MKKRSLNQKLNLSKRTISSLVKKDIKGGTRLSLTFCPSFESDCLCFITNVPCNDPSANC